MKSTFSRILTAVAIALLAALLLIGIFFQLLVRDYLTDTAVDSLKADGEVLVELVQVAYSEAPGTDRNFSVALTVATSVSGADAVICDDSGKLILCARSPFGCEHQGLVVSKDFVEKVFRNGSATDTGVIQGLYPERRYVVALPILNRQTGDRMGIIIMSMPMEETIGVLRRISEIFVFVSILVVLLAVCLMTLFVRNQSKPLRVMAKAARAFGHGELTARVDIEGNYTQEVEDLALAFNNMASSLQKSEYQRQEFVANVSHELKTPMTTIAGYVDGILDGTIPEEKGRQYLQVVSDETKRLNRLVRSMLDISQLQDQQGIPEEQKTRFDVEEALGQVLISFEQKIEAKKLQVQVDMPEHPVFTQANQDYITQVLYNLVDNGVKFCPEGGALALSIREGSGKVYVSVANEGQTIPAEELPLVFDRFHKTDKSRSQNRDSWGLGLYIVKTIVSAHGENISVDSRDGKTTFAFTLPRVN
ncbi:MAG: HAMP domain-containing histidine kinase [Oscillospiraceae bacterium]|nr:HAMP domain-containing histidine kinase [Oscillospiraceae bacterium]